MVINKERNMEPEAKARLKQLHAAPGQPWYQDDEPYEGAWHLSLKDDCGDDYISGYISIVPLEGPHEFVRRWGVVYNIDKEEDATPWSTDRLLLVLARFKKRSVASTYCSASIAGRFRSIKAPFSGVQNVIPQLLKQTCALALLAAGVEDNATRYASL
jgi:hypothetical protein